LLAKNRHIEAQTLVLMNPFILSFKVYGLNVHIHKHSAYQIILALNNSLTSIINNVPYTDIVGFVIRPQVPHACTILPDTTVCILNIEAYSRAGLQLRSLFADDQPVVILERPADVGRVFDPLRQQPPDQWPTSLSYLLTDERSIGKVDDRVRKLIDYIEQHYTLHTLTPQRLAEEVFLSPSRMAALFKAETGSSPSKYLLWTRLRHAIDMALTDRHKHLTEIAYETGFYDQAQFTKYMYEMMGVPPRALKQNSDLIQVLG